MAVRQQRLTPLTARIEKRPFRYGLSTRRESRATAEELATRLGASASFEDGSTELLGDEGDHAKAEAVYQAKIHAFEEHSPTRFSSLLSSRAWQSDRAHVQYRTPAVTLAQRALHLGTDRARRGFSSRLLHSIEERCEFSGV